MEDYEAFDLDAEESGRTILSVLDGLGEVSSVFEKQGKRVLAENGIEDPQPDEWYPVRTWLDAFETISEEIGAQTVRTLGQQIPKAAEWPSDIDSATEGLAAVDDAYQMSHRGGDIGHYDFEPLGEAEGRMVCENPYPCEFDRGLLEATVAEFDPEVKSSFVEITHDGHCRSNGAAKCTYRIRW